MRCPRFRANSSVYDGMTHLNKREHVAQRRSLSTGLLTTAEHIATCTIRFAWWEAHWITIRK
eukprot:7549940-Pyramimonas_sp.AAC.1